MQKEVLEFRNRQFEEIAKEMLELFKKKNYDYDDQYFTGDYSEIERWMSIKRKTTRLESFYKNGRFKVPDESLEDTWIDLGIYCIMELIKIKISQGKMKLEEDKDES